MSERSLRMNGGRPYTSAWRSPYKAHLDLKRSSLGLPVESKPRRALVQSSGLGVVGPAKSVSQVNWMNTGSASIVPSWRYGVT